MKNRNKIISILILVVFLCSTILLAGGCANKEYWPTKAWKTSTPEKQGMDSQKLYDMMADIKKNNTELHSVVIVKNGYIVQEAYFYPYTAADKHTINSCTKSVTSALIGIAIDEKKLKSPYERVLSFFTDRTIQNLNQNKKDITIQNLLTMQSGLQWSELGVPTSEITSPKMYTAKDSVKFVLDQPMQYQSNRQWNYSTGNSQLLSAILQKTTGEKTSEYAKKKIFEPLGIEDYYWLSTDDGITRGGSGLYLTPRDMAKFGYLYLKNGNWDGKQLISEKWVKQSTGDAVNGGENGSGYGYHWWVEVKRFYCAWGYGGQYIFVVPEKNLVAVFTSNLMNGDDAYAVPRKLLQDYIIPSVKSTESIASNRDANKRLKAINKEFTQQGAAKAVPALPKTAAEISGKVFKMKNGNTACISFDNNQCNMVETGGGKIYKYAVGLNDNYKISNMGNAGVLPDNNKIAVKGWWEGDNKFVLLYEYMTTGVASKDIYVFENGKATMESYSMPDGALIIKTESM